ncbi:MAG: 50S ribosomal protein L11 methyltransferase [Bacteroidales bacterium]|nr:50S ribosomal protein L11 methyltransferase [Bacteroidales bacterium]
MKYTAVHFKLSRPTEELREIIIAELSNTKFEGFLETETGVVAYIETGVIENTDLQGFSFMKNPAFGKIITETEFILEKNWNELWESNYEPAIISDEVVIKAPFHNLGKRYKYEITIEPKMSFGTGHHETTSLMMQQLSALDIKGQSVLDVGCGTGVLAIYASLKGATSVTAIDINEWAIENTIENAVKNNVINIRVLPGNINVLENEQFDTVIANITRNVLIEEIPQYCRRLNQHGVLLLSGFLKPDLGDITRAAADYGMKYDSHVQKKDWVAAKFLKI